MDEDEDRFDLGEAVHVNNSDDENVNSDGYVEFFEGTGPDITSDGKHREIIDQSVDGEGIAEKEEYVHANCYSHREPSDELDRERVYSAGHQQNTTVSDIVDENNGGEDVTDWHQGKTVNDSKNDDDVDEAECGTKTIGSTRTGATRVACRMMHGNSWKISGRLPLIGNLIVQLNFIPALS